MSKKRVVIIGAGIGGQIIYSGISKFFPDAEVVLVGPDVQNLSQNSGLFYLNKDVPVVETKEVSVSYSLLGVGSLEDYQMKSRGFQDLSMSESSFNKVGKTVKGYLIKNQDTLRQDIKIWIDSPVMWINLERKFLVLKKGQVIGFDYLISTVPLNVFLKLIERTLFSVSGVSFEDLSREFKYSPVYTGVVGCNNDTVDKIDSVKVFYDLTDSQFYRHSSYYYNNQVVKMVSESIKDFEGRTSISSPGKIVPSLELSRIVEKCESCFDYLKICGRYARWDYHYLVDQSFEDSVNFIKDNGLILVC